VNAEHGAFLLSLLAARQATAPVVALNGAPTTSDQDSEGSEPAAPTDDAYTGAKFVAALRLTPGGEAEDDENDTPSAQEAPEDDQTRREALTAMFAQIPRRNQKEQTG
jgi:hypothetical protein